MKCRSMISTSPVLSGTKADGRCPNHSGNGIDPIDVVKEYGADAMKFTLCYLAAQGQDILIDFDSFKLGSRFANKGMERNPVPSHEP